MSSTSGEAARPGYSYVMLGAALFAFIKTFSILSPILLSFLLILLISLAVNPLISRVRGLSGGRRGATGLVVAALVVVVALTGWALFAPMQASVVRFSAHLPDYWARLQKPLIKLERQAVLFEKRLQAEVSAEIAQAATSAAPSAVTQKTSEAGAPKTTKEPESLRSGLGEMLSSGVGSFMAAAFNGSQILVVMVTVAFGVTFTLMNPRPIFGAMFSMVPERHHERALIIAKRIGDFVPGWAGATLLGMVTIGTLVFLLMWPIFGFMDALVLGLIAGILEAIPYVGPILSAVPALLFAMGKGGMTPIWVVLAYLAIQALENNVITPSLMSRSTKLHPVAVIFSMLLCVAAFGVLGVVVAAPVAAILDIMHDEVYRKRFLPTVTDADLDCLARKALHEKISQHK